MAEMQSIDMKGKEIAVTLKISPQEYKLLQQTTKDLLLVPTTSTILDEVLTTGKLGNSNRIMLPNKILKRHNIPHLIKKVRAKIFEVEDEKFLVIRLKESKTGIPIFESEEEKE